MKLFQEEAHEWELDLRWCCDEGVCNCNAPRELPVQYLRRRGELPLSDINI